MLNSDSEYVVTSYAVEVCGPSTSLSSVFRVNCDAIAEQRTERSTSVARDQKGPLLQAVLF